MSLQPRYMTAEECRLAKLWRDEDQESVAEIARRLRRNESSIWDFLKLADGVPRGVGRRAALSDEDKTRLVRMVEQMVREANTRWTATMDLIQRRYRPKVCRRVLQEA